MEELYEKYVTDGYVVLHNFVSDKEILSQVRSQVLHNTSSSPGNYKFGKASRHSFQEIINTPVYKLYNNDVVKYFVQKEIPRVTLSEVFTTHEYTSEDGIERNGFLHFDRLWRLKFFYYLSDVKSLDNGPLCVVPQTQHRSKELRTKQLTNEYSAVLNRPKLDFPDYYNDVKERITPIYGNAGTLIIFNTDTLHKGGTVFSGKERLVCRLHVS